MKKRDVGDQVPILTLLHLDRLKGWKAHLLHYRRHREARSSSSAPGMSGPTPICAPKTEPLTVQERSLILDLARKAVLSAVAHASPPEAKDVTPRLTEKQACFVTLTTDGALRGCIGHLVARAPLYQAVIESARNAAVHDLRFPPLQRTEMDGLRIEVSVLTAPVALSCSSPEDLLAQLKPGEHGVTLQIGSCLATFLPRVWAQIPDKAEFLDRLAEKAGCSGTAWRGEDATVSVYYAECFEEPGTFPLHN
jgi:AmmeMemoRadiSam system protein A